MTLEKLAARLDTAARAVQSIAQLSEKESISLEEAYQIQRLSVDRRLARGERLTGIKLGFTSVAKMQQMGVNDLIWGRLTDKMAIPTNGKLRMSEYIHPRAEPEIAFLLQSPLRGAMNESAIRAAVGSVAVALEIIDSRYQNFKFSLEDVVADNCSSAAYAIGPWLPANQPIEDVPIALSIDGQIVHEGSSSAILGNPWKSMYAAARILAENDIELAAGSIILAGAATPAVYHSPGQTVTAAASGLGAVTIFS
ncbi:MAG: fumarylacetoacetate hydrolase family protein [Bacteroidota bacterium]